MLYQPDAAPVTVTFAPLWSLNLTLYELPAPNLTFKLEAVTVPVHLPTAPIFTNVPYTFLPDTVLKGLTAYLYFFLAATVLRYESD